MKPSSSSYSSSLPLSLSLDAPLSVSPHQREPRDFFSFLLILLFFSSGLQGAARTRGRPRLGRRRSLHPRHGVPGRAALHHRRRRRRRAGLAGADLSLEPRRGALRGAALRYGSARHFAVRARGPRLLTLPPLALASQTLAGAALPARFVAPSCAAPLSPLLQLCPHTSKSRNDSEMKPGGAGTCSAGTRPAWRSGPHRAGR